MDLMDENIHEYIHKKEYEFVQDLLSYSLVSENDLVCKYYSLLESDLPQGYIISSQWRVFGTKNERFDLAIIKKWPKVYLHTKECFDDNKPVYAVEFKIDDGHLINKTNLWLSKKMYID